MLLRAGRSLDEARLIGPAVEYWRDLSARCDTKLMPGHPDALVVAAHLAAAYLAAFGAMIFMLTGRPLRLMRRNHQICSGLVVRALQKGGLLKGADPDLMLPADLAKIYGVATGSEIKER